jgi:hypothetical protein
MPELSAALYSDQDATPSPGASNVLERGAKNAAAVALSAFSRGTEAEKTREREQAEKKEITHHHHR